MADEAGVGDAVLAVRDLSVRLPGRQGSVTVVDRVSFQVGRGQCMGIVGESGSGKSMTGYALMGLVGVDGHEVTGEVVLGGRNLLALPGAQMREMRGNRIAMVFQDPMMTLNPVLRIDTQMVEAVQAHAPIGRAVALRMAVEALKRVGLPEPERRLREYPHQLSGGMRQRIAIALALINKPDLMICDEPTTALDVTTQAHIVAEVRRLCREDGTALVWISHDLDLVAAIADTIGVMYAGRLVENGTAAQVLGQPRHPYTAALLACMPSRQRHGQDLLQIRGGMPLPHEVPAGCGFRTRCDHVSGRCLDVPAPSVLHDRMVRCFHPLSGREIP
jgi:peptide/nickel transport system ATP-binding protein